MTNTVYWENDSAHHCLHFSVDFGAFKEMSNDLSLNQPSTVNERWKFAVKALIMSK